MEAEMIAAAVKALRERCAVGLTPASFGQLLQEIGSKLRAVSVPGSVQFQSDRLVLDVPAGNVVITVQFSARVNQQQQWGPS